jgi:hypothetical protein
MGKISIGNTSVSHWTLVWQILSRMRLSVGEQLTIHVSLIFLQIKILYVHMHTFFMFTYIHSLTLLTSA